MNAPHTNRSYAHPPLAAVRGDGVRDLSMEARVRTEDGVVHVYERDGEEVVCLHLSPAGLEFIERAVDRDGYGDDLRYAIKLAKEALWQREAAR